MPSIKASIKEWPADNVERRPIASLIPYAKNAPLRALHALATSKGLFFTTRCTTLVPTPKVRPILRMPIPSLRRVILCFINDFFHDAKKRHTSAEEAVVDRIR